MYVILSRKRSHVKILKTVYLYQPIGDSVSFMSCKGSKVCRGEEPSGKWKGSRSGQPTTWE